MLLALGNLRVKIHISYFITKMKDNSNKSTLSEILQNFFDWFPVYLFGIFIAKFQCFLPFFF